MINKLMLAILLMTTVAFAQPGRFFGARWLAQDDQLKLTPEQTEQIQKLRTAFQTEAIDLQAKMQKLRVELNEQLQADNPNRKAINSTLDKIAAEEVALEKLQIGHHLEVRALLTDEQKKVFHARPFGRGVGKGYRGLGRGWGRRWRW